MKERKKFFNKIMSIALAAAMIVSVFAAAPPQQVQAATKTLSFNGSGSSKVTIRDAECTAATGKFQYIKFKSKVTGYITLKFANASTITDADGYFTFCNSKKKTLGVKDEYYNTASSHTIAKSRTYAVKKNATYYFKINSQGGVKISASVKAVKKAAGTKKGNAKTLAKNKAVKGVIIAGDSTADWYKVKLTKKAKITVKSSVKSNGVTSRIIDNYVYYYGNNNGIKVTIYDSKGKKFTDNSTYNMTPEKSTNGMVFSMVNNYGQTSGVNPGTYYIKVERMNKTSSGYYTLKWR